MARFGRCGPETDASVSPADEKEDVVAVSGFLVTTLGAVLLPTFADVLPFLKDVPGGQATLSKTASGRRSDINGSDQNSLLYRLNMQFNPFL